MKATIYKFLDKKIFLSLRTTIYYHVLYTYNLNVFKFKILAQLKIF